MIVLLLNQKCGVGRTAPALHFAGVRACQSRPLTVIDADRRALRGTGPSIVRMFGYPTRFADPDISTSYARNNGVNEQLGDPPYPSQFPRPHLAGTARRHQGHTFWHGIATASAPHDLAQAHPPL
jgi:hypothetical protein